MRRPNEGDKIRHHTPYGTREGVVDTLLSSQFVYTTGRGMTVDGEFIPDRWFAFYTDPWEHIKD